MKQYPNMNAKNTALLIIDVVNSCCHKSSEDPAIGIRFTKIRKMIPRMINFIDSFRKKAGGKIIYANITPWTKKYLAKNIIELYDNEPKSVYYSDDETGFSEKFFLVKPTQKDIVITKNNYDVFANPKFEKLLKKEGVKYLVVAGVFTDGCVLATICGGFQKGFSLVILKDLVETTDVKIRQELQKYLINYTFPRLYGKTITSKEFLKSWK